MSMRSRLFERAQVISHHMREYWATQKAGNAQVRRRLARAGRIEGLESRTYLAAISWDGGGDGANWSDAKNWVGDVLPGAADDVTISVAGSNPTIQITTGSVTIHSLQSDEVLNVSGGKLAVSTAAQLSADLTLGGTLVGGAWTATGGAKLSVNGGMLDGVTLNADVTAGSYDALRVKNGLVLNSVITLSAAVWSRVYFEGTQTLSGTGKVVLAGIGQNDIYVRGDEGSNPATLTVGPGIEIHGGGNDAVRSYYRASVADTAAFRIDFAEWLGRMRRRDRRIINALAAGEGTTEVANHCRLSPARISELRREYEHEWAVFQGDVTTEAA